MNLPLRKLLLAGVLLEVLILIISYVLHPENEDTARYAARYSGRLSFIVFTYTFYIFASTYRKPFSENPQLKNLLSLFAVLHVIHWFFLAASVYLNEIPLEIPKVIGGALAYLMIVAAPFTFHRLKRGFQLVYFYYVSIVMIGTFVARIKGELQGADPYWFHYAGVATMLLSCIIFGVWIARSSKK